VNALVDSITKWLTQKPVEPSVMAAIPSRARLASDTQADRESRAEILRVLGMLPVPGSEIVQVAGDLAAESETTPLGVAKAVAGAMMPVRGGPGKINMMGEASKVAPETLKRIQEALARKVPAKLVYQSENALPMLRPETPKQVTDAWVPIMPRYPTLNKKILTNFRDMRDYPDEMSPDEYIKTTWGALYGDDPANVAMLKKHYPDVLDQEVRLRATDPMGSGQSTREFSEIDAFVIDPRSPRSLQAIAAHEGTHDIARSADLAPGYNQRATRGDINRQLQEASERAEMLRALGQERDADLLDGVIQNKLTLEPGLTKLSGDFAHAPGDVKALARALAWQKRLMEMDDPFYKLYRAYHGEQAAKGAQQYASGDIPHFTTPLSKQILTQGTLERPYYPIQLQQLFELKKAGFFDPALQPYEMPMSFDPRAYKFQQATK
jgi:hypothetical protein